MNGQEVIEFAVGAGIAFVGAWGLYRPFIAQETYFAWILPLFLVGIFVGAIGFGGGLRPLAVGALTGLIAGGIVLGWRSRQLHRAHQSRLVEFARELGLSFSRNDQTYTAKAAVLVDELGHCSNVLRGDWRGASVAVFDYQYIDSFDLEVPAAIVLTCAVAILDDAQPCVIVRGHRLSEMLDQRFGTKTGLLGDERFDRQFRVETADLEKAQAALPPRTREWLLANARNARVLVDGTTVMLCTGHQTMSELPEVLDRIRSLRVTFG